MSSDSLGSSITGLRSVVITPAANFGVVVLVSGFRRAVFVLRDFDSAAKGGSGRVKKRARNRKCRHEVSSFTVVQISQDLP